MSIIKKKIDMENETGCKKCKKKGLSGTHWVMVVLSLYILFSAIYGTIQLFKLLISNI